MKKVINPENYRQQKIVITKANEPTIPFENKTRNFFYRFLHLLFYQPLHQTKKIKTKAAPLLFLNN